MEEKKPNGAMLGLIVIVIILIIGGIYIWQASVSKPSVENPIGTTEGTPSAQNQALTSQDASAVDALDQDAQKTDASTGVDVKAVQ